jgi:hypothetical protein
MTRGTLLDAVALAAITASIADIAPEIPGVENVCQPPDAATCGQEVS